jgi:hypothetical protein
MDVMGGVTVDLIMRTNECVRVCVCAGLLVFFVVYFSCTTSFAAKLLKPWLA